MDTVGSFQNLSQTASTRNQDPSTSSVDDAVKRLFDILCSALGLLFLIPVFLLIAILIRLDSPGPIFFQGPRAGRGGRNFKILKFRTMHEAPASYAGPKVTAEDDPRVTSLGKRLRDSKINELPQLWNVLIGDMSLVGPRPEDPDIVATLDPTARDEILSVRPGITSPSSVLYRNEEALLTSGEVMATYLESILPTKMRLDQLYVRHRSFWLDLDIIFWTLMVLLPQMSAVAVEEDRLFLGPVSRIIRRHLSWFFLDTIVAVGAMGLAALIWRSFTALHIGWPLGVVTGLGFGLVFSLSSMIWGVNRISWSTSRASDVFDLVAPMLAATVAALIVNKITGDYLLHRRLLPVGLILSGSLMACAGFVALRYRARLISGLASRWLEWRSEAVWESKERVLIVGGGEAGQFMAWQFHHGSSADAFRVVGFVDDDLYKQGTRIQGLSVLGKCSAIPDLVQTYDVGIIIFAIHRIDPSERQHLLELCWSTPARTVLMQNILGLLNEMLMTPSPDAPETRATANSNGHQARLEQKLAEIEENLALGDVAAARAQVQALRLSCQAEPSRLLRSPMAQPISAAPVAAPTLPTNGKTSAL